MMQPRQVNRRRCNGIGPGIDGGRGMRIVQAMRIDVHECCLVVIDVQGKLAGLMWEKDALLRHIEVLIRTARALEMPILWCQQVPRALGPTVEPIAQLLEGIAPIDKTTFSCHADSTFRDRLIDLDRRQAILCGIETHVCVYQTARDLAQHGYDVAVVADAVSSRTAENRRISLERMQAEGATLYSTEMLLFELLGDANHPHFRDLSRLIR